MDDIEYVKELINKRDFVSALQALDPIMSADPDDALALFCLSQIMLETDKQSIAYPILKHLVSISPSRPEVWINMGKAAGELHFYDEEEKCFKKALSLAKKQNNSLAEYIATQNLGTGAVHQVNPDKAIYWAKKALSIKESKQSKVDLGFSYLIKYDFENGWKNYNAGLGVQTNRDIVQYRDEPEWDGSKGKHIIVYGEQGLGDQIAFAGAIKDARKICKSITLHVNPKLVTLFRDSFVLDTHGFNNEGNYPWLDSAKIDASVSMSRLQEYFRDDINKFDGNEYLLADTRKRIQWNALLKSLPDGLNVGIAWTGGVFTTNKQSRSTDLETLLPVLKTQGINWICLEYKDKSEEIEQFKKKHGIEIHDYSWATRTKDYGDTAALVAELDLVISVPTSVVHLAGGLGIPCWCIVHPYPHFMFGLTGNSMPYYNSVELFRRKGDWGPVVEEIRGRLDAMRRDNSGRAWTRRSTFTGSGIGQDSNAVERAVYGH